MAFLLPTNPSDMQHIQWRAREQGMVSCPWIVPTAKPSPIKSWKIWIQGKHSVEKKNMRKLARCLVKIQTVVLASRVGIAKLRPRSQDLAPTSRVICIGPILLPKKSTPAIAFQMDPNGTLNKRPLRKLLELLDTQVLGSVQWVLLEISWKHEVIRTILVLESLPAEALGPRWFAVPSPKEDACFTVIGSETAWFVVRYVHLKKVQLVLCTVPHSFSRLFSLSTSFIFNFSHHQLLWTFHVVLVIRILVCIPYSKLEVLLPLSIQ